MNLFQIKPFYDLNLIEVQEIKLKNNIKKLTLREVLSEIPEEYMRD